MRSSNVQTTASDDWASEPPGRAGLHQDNLPMDDDRPFPTMRGVLTKQEIEALLRPNLPDDIGLPTVPERIEPRPRAVFDEDEDSTETRQMREKAGGLAARMSLCLGRATGVKAAIGLRDVAAMKTTALPDLMHGKIGAVACFGLSETQASVLVCLTGSFADALIAQACGARGSTGRIGDGWTLSAIDCALLEQLLGPLGEALDPGLRLQAIETDIPYVTSLLPAGEVIVADYAVEAPGTRTEMAVITTQSKADPASERPVGLRGRTPMTAVMTARIASLSVPMSHLTSLKAGSTLLLGLPADQPVEVLSGDRDGPVAFEGQIGRKGNKVAVKITRKLKGVVD